MFYIWCFCIERTTKIPLDLFESIFAQNISPCANIPISKGRLNCIFSVEFNKKNLLFKDESSMAMEILIHHTYQSRWFIWISYDFEHRQSLNLPLHSSLYSYVNVYCIYSIQCYSMNQKQLRKYGVETMIRGRIFLSMLPFVCRI